MATHYDLDAIWRDRQSYTNPLNYQLLPDQVATWPRSARSVRALPQNANLRPLDFVAAISIISVTLPYPRVELFANNLIEVSSITTGSVLNTLLNHAITIGQVLITSSPGYTSTNGISRNVEYHVVATPTPTSFQVSLVAGGAVQNFTLGSGLDLIFAALGDPLISSSDYEEVTSKTKDALQLLGFPRIYLDIHTLRFNDPRCIQTVGGILADAKFVLGIDKVQYTDKLQPIWIHYKSHGEQVMRFKRDDPLSIRFMTRDGTTIPFFDEPDITIPTNPSKQSLITFSNTPYIRDNDYANHMTEPLM